MITHKVRIDLSKIDPLVKRSNAEMRRRLFMLGDSVVADIRSHWSPESPSAPGTPPAVVTGKLDKSVRIDKRSTSGHGGYVTLKVGSSSIAPYAGVLEYYLNRPFFAPALERAIPRAEQYFIGVIR